MKTGINAPLAIMAIIPICNYKKSNVSKSNVSASKQGVSKMPEFINHERGGFLACVGCRGWCNASG